MENIQSGRDTSLRNNPHPSPYLLFFKNLQKKPSIWISSHYTVFQNLCQLNKPIHSNYSVFTIELLLKECIGEAYQIILKGIKNMLLNSQNLKKNQTNQSISVSHITPFFLTAETVGLQYWYPYSGRLQIKTFLPMKGLQPNYRTAKLKNVLFSHNVWWVDLDWLPDANQPLSIFSMTVVTK